jgi:hypothetical protein
MLESMTEWSGSEEYYEAKNEVQTDGKIRLL